VQVPEFQQLEKMLPDERLGALADVTLMVLAGAVNTVTKKELADVKALLMPDTNNPVAVAKLFLSLYISAGWGKSPQSCIIVPYFASVKSLEFIPEGNIAGVTFDELRSFALKALSHPKIQETAATVLHKCYEYHGYRKPPAYEQQEVCNIQFISVPDIELFGFAGIGTVYINTSAFAHNLESNTRLEGLHSIAVKLTVASIVIQENTRIQFRKMHNAINIATSSALRSKYDFVRPSLQDPGILVEVLAYDCGGVPDWLHGWSCMREFYEQFVSAFENGTPFPYDKIARVDFVLGLYKVVPKPLYR